MGKEFKTTCKIKDADAYINALYDPSAPKPNPLSVSFLNDAKMTIDFVKSDKGWDVEINLQEPEFNFEDDKMILSSINFDSTFRLVRTKDDPIYFVKFV